MACHSCCQSFAECLLRPFQANISFKAEQRSSMEAVYNGHDVFMWLPTDYWKSLCYQALPTSSSLVPRPSTREEGLGTRLLQALVQCDLILSHRLDPAHLSRHVVYYAHAQTVCTRPSPRIEGLGTRLGQPLLTTSFEGTELTAVGLYTCTTIDTVRCAYTHCSTMHH